MSDETHFIVMVILGFFFTMLFLFRILFRRRDQADRQKEDNADNFKGTNDIHVEMTERVREDPITNPGFDSLDCNIFHNRNED